MWLRGSTVLALLPLTAAGFGSANVEWDSNNNPSVATNEPPLRDFKAPAGTRQSGLSSLAIEDLAAILEGVGVACDACQTRGHYISRVRSACLDLPAKQVRAQLTKRGVRCDGCTSREQFLDKLLDSAHLPVRA